MTQLSPQYGASHMSCESRLVEKHPKLSLVTAIALLRSLY